MQDPQSLHKYLYVHGDPVNGLDPTGQNLFLAGLGTAIHREISQLYDITHAANVVTYGTQIPGVAGAILPDIIDYSLGQIGEIKPLSPYGIVSGEFQVRAAVAIANGLPFLYSGNTIDVDPVLHGGPQPGWIPSTWQPGVRVVWPGRQSLRYAGFVAVTVANVNGVIYYHRIRLPRSAVVGVAAAYAIERFATQIGEQLSNELLHGVRGGLDYGTALIWQYRMEALLFAAVGLGAGLYGQTIVSTVRSARIGITLPTAMPRLSIQF